MHALEVDTRYMKQITALRTAFSNNTSLLRVFLAGTDLSSEGAIGLAEFLPDIKTLIHLDLTENFDVCLESQPIDMTLLNSPPD